MKKIIALVVALLTLGVLSPMDAQAGHGWGYGYGCHGGGAVLYFSTGGGYCYPRPYYGYSSHYCYPRYAYGCYPRSYGYSYPYRYRTYGYGCRPYYGYRRW